MGIEVGIGFAIGAALAGAGVGMAAAAAIGAVLGSMIVGAVVGAAIGGLSAAITGGDIGRGMLFGAIGGAVMGGVSGYMSNVYGSATTATAETGTQAATTTTEGMLAAPEIAGQAIDISAETATNIGAEAATDIGKEAITKAGTEVTTQAIKETAKVPWYQSEEVISGGIKAVGETGAKALSGGTGAEEAAAITAAASKENLAAQLAAQREIEFGRLAESRAARELPFTEAELARKRRQATLTGVASSPTTATRGLLNA